MNIMNEMVKVGFYAYICKNDQNLMYVCLSRSGLLTIFNLTFS